MKRKSMPPASQGSTLFLRLVVYMMGGVALLLCYLILPAIYTGWEGTYPHFAYLKYPFLITLAATTIPFFIALYQTLKLLQYIDTKKAFSELSVRALQRIKYCALGFSLLYAVCLPPFYIIARSLDAPGFMTIGMVMCFAPLVIAVFTDVLQKLLLSALTIKKENDLTV
jgi:Protein of unknown function (DUF2975)